jgi:hypothetical protein
MIKLNKNLILNNEIEKKKIKRGSNSNGGI